MPFIGASRLAGAIRHLMDRLWPAIRYTEEDPSQTFRARYRAAVEDLPPIERRVFELHRIHDLSIEQIAKRLDLATPIVERHLGAALAIIAAALDDRP